MKFDRKRQITWKDSYSWLALTMFVNGKGIYFNSKVEHEVEVIMAVFFSVVHVYRFNLISTFLLVIWIWTIIHKMYVLPHMVY